MSKLTDEPVVAAGEPSYVLESDEVRVVVSRAGGQAAPITFFRASKHPLEPYYVSPWSTETAEIPPAEPCVRTLRGDFLGFPFGNPGTHEGKSYLLHGETSYEPWSVEGASRTGSVRELVMTLKTTEPAGRVTKRLALVDGQNVVYVQHRLAGYSGSYPVGHHAMLAMPEEDHSVLLGLSAYRYGRTWPTPFGDPAGLGSYYALAVDQRFERLDRVPTIFKASPDADYSSYPTGRGYTDGLMVFSEPAPTPAWTAATFTTKDFLWFALKDSSILPSTLIWTANRGRHFSPWNGREACLGLEDVRSYFGAGVAGSVAPNSLSRDGIPTTLVLDPSHDTVINHIQGVARTPDGFGRVVSADFTAGHVAFRDATGHEVVVAVAHDYLRTGELAPAG